MESKNFKQAIGNLEILNLEDLLNVTGGEVVVSNSDAAGIGNRAGQALQNIAQSWNSFWSEFKKGYDEHRK